MASSCNLAVPNIKLSKFEFGRANVGNLHQRSGLRVCTGTGQIQYAGVAMSRKTNQSSNICCSPSSGVELVKDTKSSGLTSQLIPNSSELESLVTEICNTDSVAEVELKLGGFRLYLMRDLTETPAPVEASAPASTPAPAPAPVKVNISADASELNGSASSTSLAISKPTHPHEGILSFLERAADEGLMILHSPRVGFFRRSRTIKGKRAPPSCKEGEENIRHELNYLNKVKKQIVKEGQVLCFIEQLGGELPIESDVSGEVIRILREDGEPVGYGDALIAILPSFPGIKKLQ